MDPVNYNRVKELDAVATRFMADVMEFLKKEPLCDMAIQESWIEIWAEYLLSKTVN